MIITNLLVQSDLHASREYTIQAWLQQPLHSAVSFPLMACHWSFGPGKIGPGGPVFTVEVLVRRTKITGKNGPPLEITVRPVRHSRHWKYLSGQSAPLTQVNHKASRHFYGIRSFQALASKQLMLPASRQGQAF